MGRHTAQKVGPQVTCGHLGNVSLGPVGHATKHEGTQLLVDHGHVGAGELGCRPWTWIISLRLICRAGVEWREVEAAGEGAGRGGKVGSYQSRKSPTLFFREVIAHFMWKGGCGFPLNQAKGEASHFMTHPHTDPTLGLLPPPTPVPEMGRISYFTQARGMASHFTKKRGGTSFYFISQG